MEKYTVLKYIIIFKIILYKLKPFDTCVRKQFFLTSYNYIYILLSIFEFLKLSQSIIKGIGKGYRLSYIQLDF